MRQRYNGNHSTKVMPNRLPFFSGTGFAAGGKTFPKELRAEVDHLSRVFSVNKSKRASNLGFEARQESREAASFVSPDREVWVGN